MFKFSKRVWTMLLCVAISAAWPLLAEAENVTKAAVSDVEYYLVRQTDTGETETLIGNLNYDGQIRAKVQVYNYNASVPISAVLISGVFDKETEVLKSVIFDTKTEIAAGTAAELQADVVIENHYSETIKSFVWENLSSLKPLGNTAPTAPTDVTVSCYTNSTADITWTNSVDDANAITGYNVYRDGKYVGSTIGSETSFKDVGIEHNTTVSYTVTAVDAVGAESEASAPSESITTKDIARLWLGAAASITPDGETYVKLSPEDYAAFNQGAENIEAVGLITDMDIAVGAVDYSTQTYARTGDYEYETNKQLGLDAVDFNVAQSRILASIKDGQFLDGIKNEQEIKIIMNYYDNTSAYAENIGKNVSTMIRYASSASTTQLVGTTGINPGKTNRWKTAVFTVPTVNNTSITSGSTSVYADVYKDRAFNFTNITSAVSKGSTSANTLGTPAMFAIGSNNKSYPSYIQRIDIAGADYVPYGAVLDLDKQGDTQYIDWFKRDGYNMASVETVNGKKAIKLYSTANDTDTAEKTRTMSLSVSSNYISSEDNRLIMRVTYLDNYEDERDNVVLAYVSENGTKNLYIPKRTNTGEWKTAEFFIDDAMLDNSLNNNFSVRVMGRTTVENPVYVSRVEIIKR